MREYDLVEKKEGIYNRSKFELFEREKKIDK